MAKQIASGNVWNLSKIKDYEGQFAEGDTGKVVLGLRSALPDWAIDIIESGMRSVGILYGRVTQTHGSSAKLTIPFKKGFPPLAIIAGVLLGIAILYIILTNWQLFKDVVPALPWLIVAGAVAIGILYLYAGYTRIRGGVPQIGGT